MSKYQQFIFESYHFDPETGVLQLHYCYDQDLHFSETYRFNFSYAAYDQTVLDRALQSLFFLAGVSYYKMYVAPEIIVRAGQLDSEQAAFFGKVYQRGLGEFWYVNQLDPHTPVTFPITTETLPPTTGPSQGAGQLVSIGGGKDSLVTVEMLRDQPNATTWSLNHRAQLEPLVQRIGLPHTWVERTWDPKIAELNKQDALNGHVPISAIFMAVGTIVAILAGKQDVVMSSEHSANEPTLHYRGMAINHQYSKSQEFERDYQRYLTHTLGQRVRCYSFLRPLSEVRISELFVQTAFKKYKDVFSSCNRAFVLSSHSMSWCGECSKCAFIFLALAPFLERNELEALWGDKNLLLNPALEHTYRKILGIAGDKPLDCVGDIKESRTAMRLAFAKYPELAQKYHFTIPSSYHYDELNSHEMPADIAALFTTKLALLTGRPV